jgi:transmembrane sensor
MMRLLRFWWRTGNAAEWFARIRGDQFDRSADAAWRSWADQDTLNRQAFERIETSWEAAALVRDRPQIRSMLDDVDRLVQRHSAGQRKASFAWAPQLALAGIAMLALTVAIGYWYLQPRLASTSYVTAIGEQRVVTLEDQSSISLNTGTRIRVYYSRHARVVELLTGEAVFTVVPDAQRPFEVKALERATIAVGTKYAVQITGPESVDVTVLEGIVSIAGSNDSTAARVAAGQAASYTLRGPISAIRPADTLRIQAWQQQQLVFNDVPLAVALAEFNRYVTTPVVAGNAELSTRRIGGVFQVGQQEEFLSSLEDLLQVRATRLDGQILLLPAP